MTAKAKPLIHEKIAAAMADVGPIGKDSVNQHQRYNFRGIDAIMNVVHNVLVKHGLYYVPKIIHTDRQILDRLKDGNKIGHTVSVALQVEYRMIAAEDGSEITFGPFMGEANDTADKACNKAMSAALKYFLVQSLCIPIEALPDSDVDPVEPPPAESKAASVAEEPPKPTARPEPPGEALIFAQMVCDKLAGNVPEGMELKAERMAVACYDLSGRWAVDIEKITATASYFSKQMDAVCDPITSGPQPMFAWTCNNLKCLAGFDSPTENGLCPSCLTEDISQVKDGKG